MTRLLHVVAALQQHRHQLLPDNTSKDEDEISEITTFSLTPPSPPRRLKSLEPTPEFQPRQSLSNGTSPTPLRKEHNATPHQNEFSLNSPPQSSGLNSSKTSIRTPPIDDSPLNSDELFLYQFVTRNLNTFTIQSSAQLRVLFRLDIPLHWQRFLEWQAAVQSDLKCTPHAITQNPPMVSLAFSRANCD
jgi:hypothetical protein